MSSPWRLYHARRVSHCKSTEIYKNHRRFEFSWEFEGKKKFDLKSKSRCRDVSHIGEKKIFSTSVFGYLLVLYLYDNNEVKPRKNLKLFIGLPSILDTYLGDLHHYRPATIHQIWINCINIYLILIISLPQ